ncbi:WD40-repeat-containing domain protein [Scheffersomyces xylosifermentans]|uniref:WD40-repeat-containing domain protein n=1 Tax=Scheffersomyces xylosifermentans TaxID=1304137 RepID=UPI00315DE01F
MAEILERIGVTKTELPPCCLRIHPVDNSIVIIGTYKLEDDGSRHGSLDIYKYDTSAEKEDTKLAVVKQYPTKSAILDVKFSPFDNSIVVTAHSTGNIILWKHDQDDHSLTVVKDSLIAEEDVLITSVFFSPIDKDIILATATSGESMLVNLHDFSVETFDTSHDLECWTGSFGELGELSNIVFTGGDDAKLIAHDIRTKSSVWSTTRRHHEAGVVSILSPSQHWNTQNPHLLWTGSYDDNLRIFDLRVMDKSNPSLIPGYIPKIAHQENLGGGVWRLIPSPKKGDNRVLTCCMYDGARIISTEDESLSVDKYFKRDHESMCYGGDWASGGDFVVTCSFYDSIVQVWSPDS